MGGSARYSGFRDRGVFYLGFPYGRNLHPKLKPKKIELYRAPLSGRMVEKEKTTRKPIAVVVENHPDARPQSGLNDAALVFETFAEGGITRFLAVFQENDVANIGPVRSARPYFVEWATSLKALFAHVGGNIDALDLISSKKVCTPQCLHNYRETYRCSEIKGISYNRRLDSGLSV
jgi:hypothetical protein